ncbi:MAG: hypothetical protein KAX84_06880 [Burkholderiales bacterium]|nr:hypothetical protein [Burkholderiales bacterium]
MRSILFCLAVLCGGLAAPAIGQSLAQLAKQQGCTTTPVVVDGTELYKCQTQSAMSYFSGPPATPAGATTGQPPRKILPSSSRAPTPANFPRVNSAVQRERDDVRKRVLTEELATEVRLMVESEIGLKSGATPLPDETLTSPKYRDRIAKLRQTVDNHSKNIQALNRELERLK